MNLKLYNNDSSEIVIPDVIEPLTKAATTDYSIAYDNDTFHLDLLKGKDKLFETSELFFFDNDTRVFSIQITGNYYLLGLGERHKNLF